MNSTAKVYEIPEETREIIETAMGLFLQNGSPAVRKIMYNTIKKTLEDVELAYMNCKNFSVRLMGEVLLIKTNNLSTGRCPQCNTDYRTKTIKLLAENRGEYFIEHTYGCKCGMVFKVAHGRAD